MYTIYSRASRVIAWLGESADGSDELFPLFMKFQLETEAVSGVWQLIALFYRLRPTWIPYEAVSGSSKLIDILEMVRFSKSTDSRDKVFAFLNLANDAKQLGIRPNYRTETKEVFVQVARSIVKAGQGGRLLLSAGISDSTLAMPSWVPDWSLEFVNEPLFARSLYEYDIDCEGAELEKNSVRVSEVTDEVFVNVLVLDIAEGLDFGRCSSCECNSDRPHNYPPANANIGRDATSGAVPAVESIPESSNDESMPQSTESITIYHITKVALRYLEQSPKYAEQNAFGVVRRTLFCDSERDREDDHLQAYLDVARSVRSQDCAGSGKEVDENVSHSPFRLRVDEANINPLDAVSRNLAEEFEGRFAWLCVDYWLVCTKDGYIGMVAKAATDGNFVVLIKGVKGPMVIRWMGGNNFKLVGTAFFAGFMYGEECVAELERVRLYEDVVLI
ncbi:hypothetical protein LTR37_001691 [Vermiconidia calcicola]|uniref:Uncharacterized protein n=1 Tax=Vermiconidia calcicola TaxID=1690605 RepID=A0ACC3NVF0_9PEZI|nr:hypothetical protein LTR37_001691 [Vermiconidia calcicola]